MFETIGLGRRNASDELVSSVGRLLLRRLTNLQLLLSTRLLAPRETNLETSVTLRVEVTGEIPQLVG